jgi:Tol biopolymer transport system component
LINGKWSEPQITNFSKLSGAEFTMSPDGKRIYFLSYRPISKSSNRLEKKPSIWVTQKQAGTWEEPILLDKPLCDMGYVCEAKNRNLYFFSYELAKFGKADIFMASYENGKYSKPISLGPNINSEFYDVDPYIAPDESYLIFSSSRNPSGLYISFKNELGKWTPARYLGDKINKDKGDGVICPSITPDGKYLFFTCNPELFNVNDFKNISYSEKINTLNSSGNGQNDIYWVSSEFINELKEDILSSF